MAQLTSSGTMAPFRVVVIYFGSKWSRISA
jgi:hypothetical protein